MKVCQRVPLLLLVVVVSAIFGSGSTAHAFVGVVDQQHLLGRRTAPGCEQQHHAAAVVDRSLCKITHRRSLASLAKGRRSGWFLQALPPTPSNKKDDHQDRAVVAVQSCCAVPCMGAVLVLWSEVSIFFTSCGPAQLTDTVERISYLLVIAASCGFWFARIVSGGRGLAESGVHDNTISLISWTERMNYLAVAVTFLALAAQHERQTNMAGLTGINQDFCRALDTL